MRRRSHDGVVESGLALHRIRLLQGGANQADVIGEILIEVIVFPEVDDEHFIVGIAVMNQIQNGLVNLGPFFLHGAGIVDYDTQSDGDVFPAKCRDHLRAVIFVNGEGTFLEIGDQAPFGVDDGGVQNYFLNLFSKDKYAGVVGGLRLIGGLT